MTSDLRITDVDITKRIKALLALRGETTIELARRLGISQPTLSYRLTGRRRYSGLCSLERIAAALGVPVPTLTEGDPWPDVRTHHR